MMRKNAFIAILAVSCALTVEADDFGARVDSLLGSGAMARSTTSVAVYDLTDCRELYSHNAGILLRPASILKLLTAVTASDVIGVDTPCFRTSLYVPSHGSDGIVRGDIYVRGGFDPEFMDADMDRLVSYLKSAGISRIEGRAVGDVSMTDSLYWGPGWCWDDAPSSFQPYMSPLMYEKGRVQVYVPTLASGRPVKVFPRSTFYTVNDLRRVSPYSKQSPGVTRDWMGGSNELLVTGNASRAYGLEVSMYRSQDFFMQTFVDRLREAGIDVDGYSFGLVPDAMDESFAVTHTLNDALHEMLKESDNLSADATLFQLGRIAGYKQADRKDCIKIIRREIDRMGLDADDYKIVDGNGISLYNYVSAELMMAFLKKAYSDSDIWRGIFPNLPVSGRDGTLKHRMGTDGMAGKVRAKTGTVSGVSSLAGYVTTHRGHVVAFVIMSNGVIPIRKGTLFQNEVCEMIYNL